MKTKLIKLSEQHYIIVDDSEIKEGYWYLDESVFKGKIYQMKHSKWGEEGQGNCKKITHSTQPIELSTSHINTGLYHFDKIKPLSLSEVEEVINGYSANKLTTDFSKGCEDFLDKSETVGLNFAYLAGFEAHQKLVKDKLFTIEDVLSFLDLYTDYAPISYLKSEFIKYSQPKTEWNIEIDNNKITLI